MGNTLKKENTKNTIIVIMVMLLIGAAITIFNTEPEIVEVPVTIEVPIPVVVKEFDTIKEFVPIYREGKTKIDSLYYTKYMALTDSIQRDSLFKSAITIREYREKVEDDTLTINIYTKVQGFMKEQQVGYKTKPRNIRLDTVLKVPIPKKTKMFGGLEIGMPINKQLDATPLIKANLILKNKKDNLLQIGLDNQIRVWVGYSIKF